MHVILVMRSCSFEQCLFAWQIKCMKDQKCWIKVKQRHFLTAEERLEDSCVGL